MDGRPGSGVSRLHAVAHHPPGPADPASGTAPATRDAWRAQLAPHPPVWPQPPFHATTNATDGRGNGRREPNPRRTEGQTGGCTLLRSPTALVGVAELDALPAAQIPGSVSPEGWAPWDGKTSVGFQHFRPGLLRALSSDSPLRSSSPQLSSFAVELMNWRLTPTPSRNDIDGQNRIQQSSSSPGCSVVWEV